MSDMNASMVETTGSSEYVEDTLHGKFLVFTLDSQRFSIAIAHVIDIINMQSITRVPNCPDYISGITNLRGKVIPIIDLRLRFGKMPQETNDRTCIIVLEQMNMQVGIVVDSVSEVINMPDENISPPPSYNSSSESRFIEGVGRVGADIYLLLNCVEVLGHDFMEDLHDEDD
ncbi:MAG: chemotaxis protein CheW [Oscillospiraceae bacterium]|nr:chemotaxis protein CheW [Oscillospiraceae bacterium]